MKIAELSDPPLRRPHTACARYKADWVLQAADQEAKEGLARVFGGGCDRVAIELKTGCCGKAQTQTAKNLRHNKRAERRSGIPLAGVVLYVGFNHQPPEKIFFHMWNLRRE